MSPQNILRSLTNRLTDDGKMGVKNQQVSDEDILTLFRDSQLPMTAPELSQELPITRQGVHKRVKKMAAQGTLEKKETGSTTIYWLPGSFPPE